MSPEEQRATVDRLIAEHKDLVKKRLLVVEREKQVADALKRLADAIDRKPDFDAVSQDSILHEYLDLSRIAVCFCLPSARAASAVRRSISSGFRIIICALSVDQ